MTQEEKQLLLKDLCARLPYRVQGITEDGIVSPLVFKGEADWDIITSLNYRIVKHGWKPYLRPMSSMTKDEYKELREMTITSPNLETAAVLFCEHHYDEEPNWRNDWSRCGLSKVSDYLIGHHFDYRGLIPMGLAIEAPEGMYDENC